MQCCYVDPKGGFVDWLRMPVYIIFGKAQFEIDLVNNHLKNYL
jgi:hypothetical protein